MNLKKKIVTSLGIAVMAMAMFFSANTINSAKGDFDLASLIALEISNAETTGGSGGPRIAYGCEHTGNLIDGCLWWDSAFQFYRFILNCKNANPAWPLCGFY